MATIKDKKDDKRKDKEKDPITPGPTTGGMRSMGPQPGEATLEEKLGMEDQDPDAPGKARRDEPRQKPGSVRQGPPPAPKRTNAGVTVDPIDAAQRSRKEEDNDKRPLRGS